MAVALRINTLYYGTRAKVIGVKTLDSEPGARKSPDASP